MRPRQRVAFATAVALSALIAPIWISVQLAWDESVANEKNEGLSYAREVLRRSEETALQFYFAIRRLNQDHFPRCSPQEIDLMRQIDIGSSHIQMVGRIAGNELQCTSLGTTAPISVGEPTLITENGVAERMNVNLGSVQSDRLDLISLDGVAVLVDTSGLIDEQTEGADVELALLVPSSRSHERLVDSGHFFRPAWFNPVVRGGSISVIDDGYVVSQVRSARLDLAALSAMPLRYAYRHVRHFVLIFVPVGLLCGCGFSCAVMYIARARSSLPALLKAAARNHDFFLDYQPIVDLNTRRWVGAEALVRWRRENAVMSPASFIPLAEESGVISFITASVLQMAARDLPKLLEIDPEFRISINLTATDLKTMDTLDGLRRLLTESQALPRNVLIEATEHSFIQGEEMRNIIAAIRNDGFQVAIDDFGTGYSSLACLQDLNLDVLKIDKVFIDTIGSGGPGSPVVSHIIEIGQSLQMRIVAEGVEQEQQADFLRNRGVQYAQGWLYGKPAGLETFCEQLRASDQEKRELLGRSIARAEAEDKSRS
jgi:sensor c-di-GMP phosphodiesterase-like protein